MNRAAAAHLGGMAVLERYGPEHFGRISKGRKRIRRNSTQGRGWGAATTPLLSASDGRKGGSVKNPRA